MTRDDTNSLACAAKGVLVLGDRTLLLRQPSPQDAETTRQYLRKLIKSPLAALADDLKDMPPALREEVIAAALRMKQAPPVLTMDLVTSLMMTPEGCRFYVWLAAHRDQPDLKLADLVPLITDANADEVLIRAMTAVGANRVPESLGPSGIPTT